MPGRTFPVDVITKANNVLAGWRNISQTLQVGTLTAEGFAEKLTNRQSVNQQISTLEAQLTDLHNQRDAADTTLWDDVKRIRSVVKGTYGDDSSEYEVIGGTRRSERKKPVRKPKTTPT